MLLDMVARIQKLYSTYRKLSSSTGRSRAGHLHASRLARRHAIVSIMFGLLFCIWSSADIRLTRAQNAPQAESLRITELMAANQETVVDEDGDFSDWIELHNSGASVVNLQGYTLTDDVGEPTKWTLPTRTLAPDQYLLVYASGKNRASADGELHTNFRLRASGEYLALVDPAGTIASEFAPQYPALDADVAYGVDRDGEVGILTAPSPSFPNGFVGTRGLSISPGSQLFSNSLQLQLNSQVSGAIIRYTTDGTTPTGSSTPYSAPFVITEQTVLKARAFFASGESSAIETHRYVPMQGSVTSFSSNLPLVVIDTFGRAVEQENRIGVFAQFIDVDAAGRAALTGTPQTATYAGFNIRGALSTSWDKKQYALESQDEDGNEVDISPLGLPPESDWILNGPYADKTLMKNALVFGWWNQMGRYASRARFVEVYLNVDGALTEDDYVGVYVLLERIKRDANRVDVEKLLPTDNSAPAIDGGYIWKIDDLDSGGDGFQSSQGNPNCLYYFNVYPRFGNITAAQQNRLERIVDEYDDALFGENFTNPATGYANYIDVESFIDYGIMQDFAQNTDGYHRSVFFHKPRAGKVAMGPLWDFNFSLGVDNRGLGAPDQPVTDHEGGSCWQRTYPRLFEDPEFEIKYWDRWFALRETVFDEAKLMAEIDAYATRLDEAQARNFVRWDVLNVDIRDVTLPGTYAGAIAILKDWVSARLTWFDSLWVSPPRFNQEGGPAAAGSQLTISPPPNIAGEIYFTTDGSDPRATGGGIGPTAQPYGGPITLSETTRVRARVKVATGWSALNDEVFNIDLAAAAGSLAITEIHYQPYAPNAAEMAAGEENAESFEFIELQNISASVIDISGVQISNAVTFDFAASDYLVLQPDERVLLVEDQAAFALHYGSNLPIAGQYGGRLSNAGETIVVRGRDGSTIEEVFYKRDNGWPDRAAGKGSSLVRNSPSMDGNLAENWRPSVRFGGTPGGAPEAPNTVTVQINEVLAHSDPPLVDTIELFNGTPNLIDISNWYVSDSSQNYQKFKIPGGTAIPVGGFMVFDESDFNAPDLVAGFALNSSQGDELYLVEGDNTGQLIRFIDRIHFGATVTDESIGRWPDGAAHFYPLQERTFGIANTANQNRVRVGSIVINEIHYNPDGPDDNLEYIELFNRTETTQALDNWRVRGDIEFAFPPATTLAAGEALILVGFDPANEALAENFRNTWYNNGTVQIVGPWRKEDQVGATLNNGGGMIQLQRALEPVLPDGGTSPIFPMVEEETVRYDDAAPWPESADGGGPALERVNPALHGDAPESWRASSLNGGTPGVQLTQNIQVNVPAEPLIVSESGQQAAFTIVLQSPPRAGVTIPLLITDRTEGAISPSFVVFTTTNWNLPQVVRVDGVDDSLLDGDMQFTVKTKPATSTDPAYDQFDAVDVNFINLDDESAATTPQPTATLADAPTAVPTSTQLNTPSNTPRPTATQTAIVTPQSTVDDMPTSILTPASTPTLTPTITPSVSTTPSTSTIPSPISNTGVSTLAINLVDETVQIDWTFTADQQTLWFNVHRNRSNDFDSATLISPDFIPSHFSGTQTYQFEDETVPTNGTYYYWIEQIFGRGSHRVHGPIGPIVLGSAANTPSIYLPIIRQE